MNYSQQPCTVLSLLPMHPILSASAEMNSVQLKDMWQSRVEIKHSIVHFDCITTFEVL